MLAAIALAATIQSTPTAVNSAATPQAVAAAPVTPAAIIGVGTGTGIAAPYFGAGNATKSDALALGQYVYPAIAIAPGASRTQNMVVQNAGNVNETITLSGSSAEMITAASASLGNPSKYVLQPALADGGTLLSGDYIGASAADSMPASWISTPASVVLSPGQVTTVPVTITIPKTAKAGTYYGAAYATATGPKSSTGITMAVQSGVRAYITVS